MPADCGAAFVVIQHLAPDHKSMMSELLSRRTDMPVQTAVDDELVAADHIYVIAPEHNLDIVEGRLKFSERDFDAPLNLPIDQFLMSLAKDQEHRACAVILSGTGSDGTRGAKAVRDAGGLVIVQDPADAKFDGMPRSAINAGASDITLPAGQIPDKIVRYLKHSAQRLPAAGSSDRESEIFASENGKLLESIFAVLEAHCGIRLRALQNQHGCATN